MKTDASSKLVRQTIGVNIAKLRKARGFNQTSLAHMINVNRSYVNQIENGKSNASVDILVKIANGLDVPLCALFEGLESQAPQNLTPEVVYAVLELPKATKK